MEMRFDHIGIVVEDLEKGRAQFNRLYETLAWSETFNDPIQRVFVQFARDRSGIVYELVVPTSMDSPVAKALKSGQNLLNHLCYSVESMDASFAHLRGAGCLPLGNATPSAAYGGARIQFFLTPWRTVLELVEGMGVASLRFVTPS